MHAKSESSDNHSIYDYTCAHRTSQDSVSYATEMAIYVLQLNLSIVVTLGTQKTGCYREVTC